MTRSAKDKILKDWLSLTGSLADISARDLQELIDYEYSTRKRESYLRRMLMRLYVLKKQIAFAKYNVRG